KGEQREPAVEKRLDRQVRQSAEESIRELPVICDRGTKKNAKGYKESWNGYKLHLDTNDIGLPISALVTAASLHDSQAAIPLIKLTSGKVTYLYDLMDAAYDAKRITETSRKFGHVPITDKNSRGQEVVPMAPHEAERYKIRSGVERANSRLKEDFGANNVMVKGHNKVTLHLMFGVITLFADQLLRLIG
ncbi:MAG: transposase, partial [Desulfobulbaceae bacterium]|nr:transposase [Desulfobulbaceae bacterium]